MYFSVECTTNLFGFIVDPDAVTDLTFDVGPYTDKLLASWTPSQRSRIDVYILKLVLVKKHGDIVIKSDETTEESATFEKLDPGYKYRLYVTVKSHHVLSESHSADYITGKILIVIPSNISPISFIVILIILYNAFFFIL